ncbi:MAG: metallophosphoesterase [Ruminococcus sp.]|nr:metallophosphoesterase [Ruminococcus sp.]
MKSEKIPESFDGFRIAQVSDLHNAEFDKYNSTVLQPIFLSRPNIIVITGDMIDSRNTDVDVALSFAQKAVNIAPVYYINGNHESRVPEEYEELKKGLTEAGVTVLENESVDITIGEETISLIGINDPTFRMKLVDDTMEQNIGHQLMDIIPDNDNYKVILAHRPEYFDIYAGNVDLVLSGHAHGGQFRIPLVGGLVAPGQGFFPEYYEGSYIKDNTEMIVSRGVGNSIIPFRINNKPEIIVAELTKIAD